MAYRIRIAPTAEADIRQFARHLADYSEEAADRTIAELTAALARYVAPRPFTWPFFFLTGAPYRAYLFKVGRRTTYWIIYEIDDKATTVDILRFWNSARDPEGFEL